MADKDSAAQARWTDPGTGLIVRHPYERSPYSGAGNCWCGRAFESRLHPHPYTQASGSELCVCVWAAGHEIHTDAATAVPRPVERLRGLAAAREAVRLARGDDWSPQRPFTVCSPDTCAPEA